MLKKLLVLALVLVPFSSLAAEMTPIEEMPSGEYKLDKTHASLVWKVSHLGLSNYTARFTKFDASLDFNAEDVTKSFLNVDIDPTSIETDYPKKEEKDFNKKLVESESWFNSVKFPQIQFVSTKVEKTGDNTGKVHGNLILLGASKPVILDVTFNGAYKNKPFASVPALGFSAKTTIKRSDWGFDTYVPTIGDEVEILIETEFHGKAEIKPDTKTTE